MKVWKMACQCFTLAFWCAAACADQPNTAGFTAPLTGPTALYGLAAQNGVTLALEDLQWQNPGFLWEDDEFKPSRTVTAFKKLSEVDHVSIVIVLGSPPFSAVASLAEAKGIPTLAWASDSRPTAGRHWVARLMPSGEHQGRLLGEEARRRGYERIAIVTSANDYSNSIRAGFLSVLSEPFLATTEEVPPDMSDFRSVIMRIAARKPKSIGMCLNSGQVGQFARQLRDAGLHLGLFSCDTLNSAAEVRLAQGALDGAWFVSAKVPDWFRKRYRERFSNEDVLWTAGVYYDLVRLLYGELSTVLSSDELLTRILRKRVENGVFGSYGFVDGPNADRYLELPLVVHDVGEGRISAEK
jgi:branched-chain amino acid transport system substrate-binding protein